MSQEMSSERINKVRVLNWFLSRSAEVLSNIGSRQRLPALEVEVIYWAVFESRMRVAAGEAGAFYQSYEMLVWKEGRAYISTGAWYIFLKSNVDLLRRIPEMREMCAMFDRMQSSIDKMRKTVADNYDANLEALEAKRQKIWDEWKQLELSLAGK